MKNYFLTSVIFLTFISGCSFDKAVFGKRISTSKCEISNDCLSDGNIKQIISAGQDKEIKDLYLRISSFGDKQEISERKKIFFREIFVNKKSEILRDLDIDQDSANEAIFFAGMFDEKESINDLLLKEASINQAALGAVNVVKLTPGQKDLIRSLIKRGASLNNILPFIWLNNQEFAGELIDFASKEGLIINYSWIAADAVSTNNETFLNYAIKNRADLIPALQVAIKYNNKKFEKKIFDCLSSLDHGNTKTIAAIIAMETGNKEALSNLIKAGANKNFIAKYELENSKKPMIYQMKGEKNGKK